MWLRPRPRPRGARGRQSSAPAPSGRQEARTWCSGPEAEVPGEGVLPGGRGGAGEPATPGRTHG